MIKHVKDPFSFDVYDKHIINALSLDVREPTCYGLLSVDRHATERVARLVISSLASSSALYDLHKVSNNNPIIWGTNKNYDHMTQ